MFAKSRGSSAAPCDLLPDPIRNTYEIGKQSATAGPENVWRIYDGYRKKDRMVISREAASFLSARFLFFFLLSVGTMAINGLANN